MCSIAKTAVPPVGRPFFYGLLIGLLWGWLFPMAKTAGAETWVVLGDSITHRTTHAPPEGAWVTLLAARTGHRVINAGVDGDTTEGALLRLDRDVLAHHPDRVFIMLGANDHRPVPGPPLHRLVAPDRFAHNLNRLIDRIVASGAQVVLMTNRPWIIGQGNHRPLYLLPTPPDASRPACGKVLCRYNHIVREIAAKRHLPLVDIWQAVVDQGDGTDSDAGLRAAGIGIPDGEDGIHLGPKGHRLMADTIMKNLDER